MPNDERAPIRIRPAVPDDALCLGVLATQVFLDTYATGGIRPAIAAEVRRSLSTAAYTEALADPRSIVVVAAEGEHRVGFAQVTLDAGHALAPRGSPAELYRLYVQEPFTGRGIGSLLLAAAERAAVARGATVMWLTPWVGNLRALGFYAKHGYTDRGLCFFEMEGERHENRLVAKVMESAPQAAGELSR